MTSPDGPAVLPAFYRLIALGTVASTNDEALSRAREGASEGTLITARRQHAGRGRRGRTWESAEGNLFLSLVLRPKDGPDAAAAIGFAAALAVFDTVSAQLPRGTGVALKWPNDVLVVGRKVAGLLIEQASGPDGTALILGVGINLVSHPFDTPYPATDLGCEGAGVVSPEEALHSFCRAFLLYYRRWQKDGFAPLRAAWLTRARGLGEPLTVDVEGRRFDGVFKGIDDDGALILDLGGQGVKKVTAGDVYFADSQGEGAC